MDDLFKSLNANVKDNEQLRIPQREGYRAIRDHVGGEGAAQEIGIVLPVGCGKSGLITLTPFAVESGKALVVAPYVKLADQLYREFDPTQASHFFYGLRGVLVAPPFPEPVLIRGKTANRGDLDEAHVVITNIDQLQGRENRWLRDLPEDYFDLILFDEGHHAAAQSWETFKGAFPGARVVSYSATPRRADGQLMPGNVVYSYPVRDAIEAGYVKRLKGLVLNPATLRYVRAEDEEEREIPLEEVIRLGEEEAGFRRSIVSSKETLTTIVDASIRELRRIREETGDRRHKIIVSALNYAHCHQIVAAYRERGQRADFVHSREATKANEKVLARLEDHELDVIVQVRKLGEGFDHPYLSVAAVCSIFRELSPFVQFVGRIMRVVDKENQSSPQNQGTVVFHAGANVAQRWRDFRDFSEADQEYFDQLLPLEDLDFTSGEEVAIEPQTGRSVSQVDVRDQTDVTVQEIPLLENDEEAMAAIRSLRDRGYSLEDIGRVYEHHPVPTTKLRQRQASRKALDDQVRLLVGTLLNKHQASHEGHQLDKQRLGRSNFQVVKARVDVLIRERVANKKRADFLQADLDHATAELPSIGQQVTQEFFSG